jgi:hypothetical protein
VVVLRNFPEALTCPVFSAPVSEVCAGADDYVQGLAKRGIVKLPG